MIRNALMAVLLVAALTPVDAAAQDRRTEQARPSNNTPNRPSDDDQPAKAGANIQVEVTISDYVGSGAPLKKTVSVLVSDGYVGRVRSARTPPGTPMGAGVPMLNVDATPRIMGGDGRVSLRLILEYSPALTDKTPRGYPINESLTVTLQSGKPLVVSQGADPSTDRRVTVEVTATILK